MAQLTYLKALQWAFLALKNQESAQSDAELLLTGRLRWNHTQLVLHYQQIMPADQWQQFQQDVAQVAVNQPVQYVLGEADFYGRLFQVTPATLIPRVETEELVEWVLADHPDQTQPLKVLDVGTGSGAIAITLALERPNWQVTATDISTAALTVAQQNAQTLGAAVTFKQGDFLAPVLDQRFDLIVSNPPYIADAERTVMDESVLQYEPQTALFAPQQGLLFYERFAREAQASLNTTGQLYLEFGYQQQPAIAALFGSHWPQLQVAFRQDLAGWPRMFRGQRLK